MNKFSLFFSIFFLTLILLVVTPHTIRSAGPVRGTLGDLWADIIIGKPDFSEVTPNTVVSNKFMYPRSVIIDRSTTPNHLYIFDGSNSRIIGIKDSAKCASQGPNCQVDPSQGDIVLGQPDFYHSACNGDGGYQNYPSENNASASTLCNQPVKQLSIAERGDASSMYVSPSGDLYVTDMDNQRVLKYINPFTTDTIADDVWGQDDFASHICNKGQLTPSSSSLCLATLQWSGDNNWTSGVDLDSSGNLWVVDNVNNRVLRFPAGSHTADLVLGQPNFTSSSPGSNLNQLYAPSAVRVNGQGWVYVADYQNSRILRYKSPATGVSGEVFGPSIKFVSGLDWDPSQPGKIWAAEKATADYILIDELTGSVTRTLGVKGNGNILNNSSGSIGIDSFGDYFIPVPGGDYGSDIVYYPSTGPFDIPQKRLFDGRNIFNNRDAKGLVGGSGIVLAGSQLVVQDADKRIVFWNNPSSLTNGKPEDGVLETTDFGASTDGNRGAGGYFSTVTASDKYLYVARGSHDKPLRIERYSLPLNIGQLPVTSYLSYPFNILGGGQLNYTGSGTSGLIWGIAVASDDSYIWVSHSGSNRVFRIRDPLTTPLVDVILGQTNSSGISCNRGGAAISGALANSLCFPGNIAFDKLGNLYVSDHSLEIQGNMRLLIFSKDLFPINNASVIYAPNATYIKGNIATWEPAFDSNNRMVVGYNPYWGANPKGGWFPGVYNNPLSNNSTPDSYLSDYHSMAIPMVFDLADNLYVGDGDRSRVLIYKQPFGQIVQSSPTPTVKPGDANGDNRVDELDYNIWYSHYNQPLSGISNGDFNGDSKVDGMDYSIWVNNYGL